MKKSTLRTCLIILAVSLIISIGYVMLNRSTSREATADEIAAYQAYAVDWSAVDGWEAGMTEKEFLLTLSIFQDNPKRPHCSSRDWRLSVTRRVMLLCLWP